MLQAKHIAGKAKHRAPYGSDTQQTTTSVSSPKIDHVDVGTCEGDVAGASPSAGVSPFRSVMALQEALDSCDRTYGSPVMTLKATIDSHYSQNGRLRYLEGCSDSSSYPCSTMSTTTLSSEQQVS